MEVVDLDPLVNNDMQKNREYLKAFRDGFNASKAKKIRNYKTRTELIRTILALLTFVLQIAIAIHVFW